ncbi:SMP-30/gluconolactonase/LRE family protein [Flavicella marina]|uniref:SMP-30/gluconolactonase/LRE family protein n=1 Tax=Flavicella marina TaxID=1475951 RepID=UPI0012646F81|nr:SMP-30/gluconolactonase/LRE family protein [Flavicella marina]
MKTIHSLFFIISMSLMAQTPVQISTATYKFLEGPTWDGTEYIYFSDLNDFKVHKYSTINETFEVAFTMPTKPNGLMFDNNHNLVVCEFNVGKISKWSTDGTRISYLAETYDNKSFDHVNDLCVDKKGGVYFTDPYVGNGTPNQSSRRIYYITPEGNLTVVDDGTGYIFPNGVLISNDGNHLFANDSESYNIYKYDIDSNTGALSNKTIFATLTNNHDVSDALSRADGMTLDTDENLYISSKSTVQVFNKNGVQTNIINFPKYTTNLTFGGVSKKTLYVTGWKEVYKVEIFDEATTTHGFHHPFDLPVSGNLSTQNLRNSDLETNFFPNPTSNYKTQIDIGTSQIKKITIVTPKGEQFINEQYSLIGNMLELQLNPNFNKGVYFVSIQTKKGDLLNRNIIIN